MQEQNYLIELTTRVVEAYVEGNQVDHEAIPALIRETYTALAGLGKDAKPAEEAKPERAVTARKSLANPDQILSMIDGKPYKTLKRHISNHGFTPESYRETFGLSANYPMVAPSYSARRSEMAKRIGLGNTKGQKSKRATKAEATA
ncbi:hypothetical protein A9995_14145 [Erythrobacter sp. QSSC1-22B]|uniref:MucR family transcriptional regulator n=1 Tax=Erythrobacter sp. QSSC1-22B TaxID=1860125 RepID=UPI000804DE7A|nr:MucR family transcriptional regulator [Erythrobacter sp. QSSC1-22B]OBX17935.1 hypothetical protein A9995_14145 [Erythrobacter sp. QSSC1-22B]